jgi:hypothetical protein
LVILSLTNGTNLYSSNSTFFDDVNVG